MYGNHLKPSEAHLDSKLESLHREMACLRMECDRLINKHIEGERALGTSLHPPDTSSAYNTGGESCRSGSATPDVHARNNPYAEPCVGSLPRSPRALHRSNGAPLSPPAPPVPAHASHYLYTTPNSEYGVGGDYGLPVYQSPPQLSRQPQPTKHFLAVPPLHNGRSSNGSQRDSSSLLLLRRASPQRQAVQTVAQNGVGRKGRGGAWQTASRGHPASPPSPQPSMSLRRSKAVAGSELLKATGDQMSSSISQASTMLAARYGPPSQATPPRAPPLNNGYGNPMYASHHSTLYDSLQGSSRHHHHPKVSSSRHKPTKDYKPREFRIPKYSIVLREDHRRELEGDSGAEREREATQLRHNVEMANGFLRGKEKLYVFDRPVEELSEEEEEESGRDEPGPSVYATPAKDDAALYKWKIKRRCDGTRYVVKRSLRNQVLKRREAQLMRERVGLSTDDDAISELKFGHYVSRDERKKQLEKERVRKVKQQQRIVAAKAHAHESPIVQLSKQKQARRQEKAVLDGFTTTQELLSQPTHESAQMGILSVTAV